MVLINAPRGGAGFNRRRQKRNGYYSQEKQLVGSLAFSCLAFIVLVYYALLGGNSKSSIPPQKLRHAVDADHPSLDLEDPLAAENADFFDTVASDILQVLNCHTLLAASSQTPVFRNGHYVYGIRKEDKQSRRLIATDDKVPEDDHSSIAAAAAREHEDDYYDDDDGGLSQRSSSALVTAAHLLCLAAFPAVEVNQQDETTFWNDKIECQVRGDKQQAILDLWSTARAEIPDTDILIKTLNWATEQPIALLEQDLNVWAPPGDEGTEYIINDINTQAQKQADGDYGGIAGLTDNLGEGKLYVDVGSGLGYSAMAVSILYPGTEIVSIEAAPTNWLLQEMNWRCNDFEGMSDSSNSKPQVLLAGVGPSTVTSQLAKFIWRPTATTSTRAWSLSVEVKNNDTDIFRTEEDVELTVKLRPWHLLMAEADISHRKIDVLNVDCEGCEYNLIPSLKPQEFEDISTVMGQVHWGYIPKEKLPSSKRGKDTHARLCEHENFARTSIECCAFPHLTVKSSFSGEALVVEGGGAEQFPPQQVTVQDLAGDMCGRFETWAEEHHLHAIESDMGWFEISSMTTST